MALGGEKQEIVEEPSRNVKGRSKSKDGKRR